MKWVYSSEYTPCWELTNYGDYTYDYEVYTLWEWLMLWYWDSNDFWLEKGFATRIPSAMYSSPLLYPICLSLAPYKVSNFIKYTFHFYISSYTLEIGFILLSWISHKIESARVVRILLTYCYSLLGSFLFASYVHLNLILTGGFAIWFQYSVLFYN